MIYLQKYESGDSVFNTALLRDRFNALVDAVMALQNMSGDAMIGVQDYGAGYVINWRGPKSFAAGGGAGAEEYAGYFAVSDISEGATLKVKVKGGFAGLNHNYLVPVADKELTLTTSVGVYLQAEITSDTTGDKATCKIITGTVATLGTSVVEIPLNSYLLARCTVADGKLTIEQLHTTNIPYLTLFWQKISVPVIGGSTT